jgi:hypothetical protein
LALRPPRRRAGPDIDESDQNSATAKRQRDEADDGPSPASARPDARKALRDADTERGDHQRPRRRQDSAFSTALIQSHVIIVDSTSPSTLANFVVNMCCITASDIRFLHDGA